MSERPRRRFSVEIKAHADTEIDLVRELSDLLARVTERPFASWESVGGSTHAGHLLSTREEPAMTTEKYHAAIETWLAKDAAAGKDPKDHRGDHDCG